MTDFMFLAIPLSFIIGILIINKIREYDLYEKESWSNLLIATLIGGTISIVLTHFFYFLLMSVGVEKFDTVLGSFAYIGPAEEGAKLIAFIIVYRILKNEISEPCDGLVYMACVALGFSLIENYQYSIEDTSSSYLIFVRAMIATPGHIMFSVPMGLTYYLYKKGIGSYKYILLALLLAIVYHGLYDAFIFAGAAFIVLIFFIQFMYKQVRTVLIFTNLRSPYRKNFSDTVVEAGQNSFKNIECLKCHNREDKQLFRTGKAKFYKCPNCTAYVITRDDLFHLFYYFAPSVENRSSEYAPRYQNAQFSALYGCNYIDNTRRLGFFIPADIEPKIDEINQLTESDIESSWVIKTLFLNENKSLTDSEEVIDYKPTSLRKKIVLLTIGIMIFVAVLMVTATDWGNAYPDVTDKETYIEKHFSIEYPGNWVLRSDNSSHSRFDFRITIPKYGWTEIAIIHNDTAQYISIDSLRSRWDRGKNSILNFQKITQWGALKGVGYLMDLIHGESNNKALIFHYTDSLFKVEVQQVVYSKKYEINVPGLSLLENSLILNGKGIEGFIDPNFPKKYLDGDKKKDSVLIDMLSF